MTDNNDRLVVYFDDEEHLIRRLGAAVVALWSDMPPDLQGRLVAHAKRILDEDEETHFDDRLRQLLQSQDAPDGHQSQGPEASR